MWCLHLGFHGQWFWLDHCREDPAICICIIMQIRLAITEIASVCPNSFIIQGKSTIVVSIPFSGSWILILIIYPIKSISPSASAQSSLSSSDILYLSCMDFDSLVLHDMHIWKCMVIALNYTHTSENDRVHQSNIHSEATLELQVVQWWECFGCKSLCGFITYPSIFCGVQGWGIGLRGRLPYCHLEMCT